MYQQNCSGVVKPDNCSVSCLNVLLCIVASDFKEPLKMQQGITAVVPSILLIFHMFITSHKILPRTTNDDMYSWTAPEGSQKLNHAGGISETHQEVAHAPSVCHISFIAPKSSVSILVPTDSTQVLPFTRGILSIAYFFLPLWEIGLTLPRKSSVVSCAKKVMGSQHVNHEPRGDETFGSFRIYLKYI